MFSGAMVCAASGAAAQIRQRMVSVLLFVGPTDIDGFPALRLTDNPARFHAAANEHIGISGTPVVTPEVQVHVWSAPELMDYRNQGLIQHGLSCFLARHLRKIFDEAAERCIQ